MLEAIVHEGPSFEASPFVFTFVVERYVKCVSRLCILRACLLQGHLQCTTAAAAGAERITLRALADELRGTDRSVACSRMRTSVAAPSMCYFALCPKATTAPFATLSVFACLRHVAQGDMQAKERCHIQS